MAITVINEHMFRGMIHNPNFLDSYKEGDIIELINDKGAVVERRIIKVKKICDYLSASDFKNKK